MIAALLLGVMIPQDYDLYSNRELGRVAYEITEQRRETPYEEQGLVAARMEELYYVFLARNPEAKPYDKTLNAGVFMLCRQLALTDPDYLFEKEQSEWTQLSREAALRSGNASTIATAYVLDCSKLRSGDQPHAALAALDEARDHIAELPSRFPEPAEDHRKALHAARSAMASARLLLEEAETYRVLHRFDDAELTLEQGERAHAEAIRQGELELRLRSTAGLSNDWAWLRTGRDAIESVRSGIQSRRLAIYIEVGAQEPARALSLEVLRSARISGTAGDLATATSQLAALAKHQGDFAAAERRLRSAMDEPWFAVLGPGDKARLEYELAEVWHTLEWVDPTAPRRSQRAVERLVASERLSSMEALAAERTLAQGSLRTGELEQAQRWIDAVKLRVRGHPNGQDPPAMAVNDPWLAALEAEFAMVRRASPEELLRARRVLQRCVTRSFEKWAEIRPRHGGMGFLPNGSRINDLSVLLDITLATAPAETAAEQALEPLLFALAHGALARSFTEPGTVPEVPDLDTLRSLLLPQGGGMLVYMVSGDRSHVFAMDRAGVEVAVGHPWHEIEARRRRLLELLSRPPPAEHRAIGAIDTGLSEASRALTEVLIPEQLRRRMHGWEGLVVCGLSRVGYVPFEALMLEGAFLGDQLPISYLASPSLGMQLLEREERRPAFDADAPQLLLVAAPAGVDAQAVDKARMPWSPELERTLREAYDPSTIVSGSEATFERLATELRERPPLVAHVVAHGVGERKAETNRALLLAPGPDDDGWTRHEDLRQLQAPPLVILSSCAAGRGRARRGDDGIDDLGGACLLAGAGAVVVSSNDIHFDATMALMSVFHERLAAGETPARALFKARRVLARDDRYAHPYFRSLVHVRGLGCRPLFR